MTITEKALRLAVEQILRSDGLNDKGVAKHINNQVKKYMDMASGVRPCFYGTTETIIESKL